MFFCMFVITGYVDTGFIYLQYMVNRHIIEDNFTNDPQFSTNKVYLQKMAYPAYIQDNMLKSIQTTLPLFFVLAFILYVIMLAKNLVYEKELKLKVSIFLSLYDCCFIILSSF